MFTADEEEKTLLVHLVLEASANMFFQASQKVFELFKDTDYFKLLSQLDETHEAMRFPLFVNLISEKYERLVEVQSQGWNMMNAISERITELASS
jgi:hypothetical protein